MNQLSELTLERPTIMNASITSSDIFQPGMVDLGFSTTVVINSDT